MIFWIIFSLLYSAYAVFIVKFMQKKIYKECKYTENLNPDLKESYKPFERYDRSKWNTLEIYIGAIFLLPIRIVYLLFWVILLVAVGSILGMNTDKAMKTEQSKTRRNIIRFFTQLVARNVCLAMGYFWISNKVVDIQDIDPEYPVEKYKDRKGKQAPFVCCNHQSWVDIFSVSTTDYQGGFLSKKEVGNYPLFGTLCRTIQCIFVDRESEANKGKVLDELIQRGKDIKEGKNFPSVCIFPEGTTTNGKYLISFKKGAFEPGMPIKILTVNYKERNFNPGLDTLPLMTNFFFLICQFYNKMEITEVRQVYYPDHLNIKDYKNEWHIYAEKVKNIMLKISGCQNSEAGFKDIREYEKGELKELKESLKQKKQK